VNNIENEENNNNKYFEKIFENLENNHVQLTQSKEVNNIQAGQNNNKYFENHDQENVGNNCDVQQNVQKKIMKKLV